MQFDPAATGMSDPAALSARTALRSKLRALREAFVAGSEVGEAQAALSGHLVEVLRQLEPRCLGLYWPIRSEFNAVPACAADLDLREIPWSLPFTHRAERQMHFRRWDGAAPTLRDESGLPASDGAPVEPDVVLVPCLGYTGAGFRLGYGAGYFDRWMAAHPDATAIGVAWSVGLMSAAEFQPQQHDQPLMLVVTERGVVSGS